MVVSLFGLGGSHLDGVRVTSISIRVTSMGIGVSGMGIGVSAISGPVVVESTVVPVVVVLRVSGIRENGSSGFDNGSSGSNGSGDFAILVGIEYLHEFSLGCGNFGFVGEVGGGNGGGGQSGVFTGLGFSESSHKGFFGSGHLSGVLNGVSGGEEGNENL